MGKISVYVTEQEKRQISKYAEELNLSLSQYLLYKGLDRPIISSQLKARIASIACQIYYEADQLESNSRNQMKLLGGVLYGLLEDQA